MPGQTVNKIINAYINLSGYKVLDANGNPAQGCSFALDVISGDPTGLALRVAGGIPAQIQCLKVGTYQVRLVATNGGGSVETDAAGDTDGSFDTINVTEPAPVAQSWTYA